jgi:hypothetical protein
MQTNPEKQSKGQPITRQHFIHFTIKLKYCVFKEEMFREVGIFFIELKRATNTLPYTRIV